MNADCAIEKIDGLEDRERQDVYIFVKHDMTCQGCGTVAERLNVRFSVDAECQSQKVELCGGCATKYDKLIKYMEKDLELV